MWVMIPIAWLGIIALLLLFLAGASQGAEEAIMEAEHDSTGQEVRRVAAETALKSIKEMLDQLYAIETLEYHNKNWLAFDNVRLSREKMTLLQEMIARLRTAVQIGGNENRERQG